MKRERQKAARRAEGPRAPWGRLKGNGGFLFAEAAPIRPSSPAPSHPFPSGDWRGCYRRTGKRGRGGGWGGALSTSLLASLPRTPGEPLLGKRPSPFWSAERQETWDEAPNGRSGCPRRPRTALPSSA